MSVETSQEFRGSDSKRFMARFNIRLIGAACGILLALLIAPATRRLFLAQAGLTLPVPANVASIAGAQLGIVFPGDGSNGPSMHSDPFEGHVAIPNAHAVAARHPEDLQLQLANAVVPDNGKGDSKPKIARLRALEGRFPDSPSVYANVLRYEAVGWVQAQHTIEQYEFVGEPVTQAAVRRAAQSIDLSAYTAYDRDAAAGERLDPNNAYFPMMRAIGLFGVRHDAEALAEIARAARCTHWQEYYNDEVQGQWRLQDESSVNNSALFHALSAAAILFPQYAQMRGAVRVTLAMAMKSEQAGHIEAGLELRKNIVRIGSLMRVQASSLIGSIVGVAFTDLAVGRPEGALPIRGNERTEAKDHVRARLQFDTYLRRIGHESEIAAFHGEQQAGDDIKELVRSDLGKGPFDGPLQSLIVWWVIDLFTLSNILWLLVCGGIAALTLRGRKAESPMALPGSARVALPLGLIGGALAAPAVLTGASPYFLAIASGDRNTMLLTGIAPLFLLIALPLFAGMERGKRVGVFAGSLLAGMLLTAFYFWQIRGLAGIACLIRVCNNLSGGNGPVGPDLVGAVPWVTADVALLVLGISAIVSRACRVPLNVGIARAFRGLAAPLAATLFLAYAGMMLCTVRAESVLQVGLDRTVKNEGQYIAELSGKLWPRADVARSMVGR